MTAIDPCWSFWTVRGTGRVGLHCNLSPQHRLLLILAPCKAGSCRQCINPGDPLLAAGYPSDVHLALPRSGALPHGSRAYRGKLLVAKVIYSHCLVGN